MASILERLKSIINKSQQTHPSFNQAVYNYLGNSVIWNPENDDTFINKGYRHNATVYSIINLISKSATTIPLCIYEVKKETELKRYKALTSSGIDGEILHRSNYIKKNALVEVEDTELHELLNRPNPAQSFNSFLSEIIAFHSITGNSYVYGIKPETGSNKHKYVELYVLPSQNVEINSGGIMQPVKEYTLTYNGTYRMPAECVLHMKDFNPYYDGTGSHLYGMSPLKAGLRSMDANNEALTAGVKYLQNGTARGMLVADEGDLNEVQARQLKDKFREQHQGANNMGDVIITPKKLSWVNFGLSASDLTLIEQYGQTIKDLCNIYNVPVQLLNNTESSTYNNMKEAKKALYQNAVIPKMTMLRDELNRWLVPHYGDKLYLDFDFSVIPELQEESDKVVSQMSAAWWLTPNEKRAAMNYGLDDDTSEMNDYYIPSNFLPLKNEPNYQEIDILESNSGLAEMEKSEQTYNDYPQTATNNAKRMLEWREKYGRDVVQGGTMTGWRRASQLASRANITLSTVKRVYSFLKRHEDNATIDPKYKGEPWRDRGYVAYNLWGGAAMLPWAERTIKKSEE